MKADIYSTEKTTKPSCTLQLSLNNYSKISALVVPWN